MTHFRPCSLTDYHRARRRVAELGYNVGTDKWEAFWSGFMAWARGRTEADCPIKDITPAERARGKRTPHRRGAWLNGYAAAPGINGGCGVSVGPTHREGESC